MKKYTRSYFSRDIHKLGCLLIPLLTFMGIQSCSTVDEGGSGRCKAFKDPKYVASSQDTDGKKWQLLVSPEVVDLKCDKLGALGVLSFSATILDGQGFAKPALAINGEFIGTSTAAGNDGFKPEETNDKATDSCGTAVFKYTWKCPDQKKSTGGFFYATSGPLASKSVKITIEHIVQQDVVNGTTPVAR